MKGCLVDRNFDCDCSEVKTKIRTSRSKAFRCVECGKTIPAGEDFELYVGSYDGDSYYNTQTCMQCLELRNRFCCLFIFGEVLSDIREQIVECGDDINIGCMDDLSPGARDFMVEILDEDEKFES